MRPIQSEIPEVEPGREERLAAIETEMSRLTPKEFWEPRVLDSLFARISKSEKHNLGPAFLKVEFDSILERYRRKNIAGIGDERLAHKFDHTDLFFNPENKYDLENSKVYRMLDEFDSVSLEARFSRNRHGQEIAKLKDRKAEIREQLTLLGVRIRERELLERILEDFYYANAASKMEGASHNWSESGDEAKNSSTSLLYPLAAYLANESVHNTWTTKVLLFCLLEAIGRPHLPPKWNSGIFYLEPLRSPFGNFVLYTVLGGGVLLDRFTLYGSGARWFFLSFIPLTWCASRLHLSWKRDRINSKIDELKSHFSRFNDTFLCDGDELVIKLREVERMGVYVPSLLYPLMRLSKPKAGEW